MTLAVTNLTSGTSTSATPSTASVSVGDGELCIVTVFAVQNTGTSPGCSLSGLGLTWVNVYGGSLSYSGGRRGTNVFVAVNNTGSGVSGTIGITNSPTGGNTFQSCGWVVDKVGTGANLTTPVGGTPQWARPGGTGGAGYTLASVGTPAAGDAIYAFISQSTALGNPGLATGYTQTAFCSIEPLRAAATGYDNGATPDDTPHFTYDATITTCGAFIISAAGSGPVEEDITESAEAGDAYSAEAHAVATLSEGAEADATAAAEARAQATITEGAEAGDAYAATVVQSGSVSEGAEAGDQQQAEARAAATIAEGAVADASFAASSTQSATVTEGAEAGDAADAQARAQVALSEGAVADATFDAAVHQADDISEGAEAGSSFAAQARAGAGITEGAEAGDGYVGETPDSAVITESAEAGSTFDEQARAAVTRTEAAEAGDAYAVKARANAGISEGAEAGDEYEATSGAVISEGAVAGDAYAAVARAVAAVVAGAKAGDAYAAQGGQPIAPADDGVLAPKFAGFPNVVRRWVGDEKPQKKRRKKAEVEPAPVARGPAGLALGIGDVDSTPEPDTIVVRSAPGAGGVHIPALAGSTPAAATNTRGGQAPAAPAPASAPEAPASAAAEAPQNQPPPWGPELAAAADAVRALADEMTALRAQVDAQDANLAALADMLGLMMRQMQNLRPAIEGAVKTSEANLRREIDAAVTAVAALNT